jgi:hypothetical protein
MSKWAKTVTYYSDVFALLARNRPESDVDLVARIRRRRSRIRRRRFPLPRAPPRSGRAPARRGGAVDYGRPADGVWRAGGIVKQFECLWGTPLAPPAGRRLTCGNNPACLPQMLIRIPWCGRDVEDHMQNRSSIGRPGPGAFRPMCVRPASCLPSSCWCRPIA